MNVLEAIKERRSVRAFTDNKVSDEDIKQLLEAARWAPSAGNTQPLELVIVKAAVTKQKLSEAALNQSLIQQASIVIVVCADVTRSSRGYGIRGELLYSIQDTAAATENILLAAQELGLTTCWIGAFHEKEVAKIINAPKSVKPIAIIPVGYPAFRPVVPQKRALNEIVHYEKF